jgi:flagellar hook-associated protein 1 FlgK
VTGISRNDIPASSYIKLDGVEYKYDSIAHTVGPPESMTFNLDSATLPPAGVTTAEIGKSVSYKGIPYYIQKLNTFVRTIATRFNELHESGEGGTGVELFAFDTYTGAPPLDETDDFTYNQININNFSVNPDVLNNLDNLMTSATVNAGESESDIILSMINLRHDTDVFRQGEPDNFMQAMISEMAIDTSQAKSFRAGQEKR